MFVVVTRNFPPDVGGMQILMGGLSESLLKHGPVTVFANEFQKSDSYDKNSLTNIHRISGIKLFRKYRKASLVNEFIEKNTNIRAIFFDHWKSIELINENFLKKTKSFCLIHSKEINHKIGSRTNRRIIESINKADYIVANSRFTKELGIKVGIDENKIHIINPGINTPKVIDNLYLEKAKNYFAKSFPKIITIARLEKRKNHEKILMTLKNLQPKFPSIKYISIGDGDEKENLLKLREELKIQNNVVFLNNVTEDLKLSLISESDFFLMPSIIHKSSVEGFGISFIEASSHGIASIGGKDGGASDAIIHKKTGLICDGNDLSSIYDGILNIVENENYKKFGKNAKIFSEDFYWANIIKKYLRLIN